MGPPIIPQPDALIVEDDHGMVTYQPHDAWTTELNWQFYTDNGAHMTRANGASVEFAFTGTAVWVYGDTNRDHGEFDVRIDGGEPDRRNGITPRQQGMQVLYTTTLPAGSHRINITNVVNFKYFSIDYFAFTPLPGANPAGPTPSSSATKDPSTSSTPVSSPIPANSSLPTGAIIGIVLGLLGIILFAILGFLIMRDRRRNKTKLAHDVMPWGYAPVSGASTPMRGVQQQGYMMQDHRPPAPSSGYAYSRRPESYISVEPTLSDVPQSRSGSALGGHLRSTSTSALGMPSVAEERDVLGELPVGGPTRGDRFRYVSNDSYSTWVPPDSRYFTSTEGGNTSLGVRSPA